MPEIVSGTVENFCCPIVDDVFHIILEKDDPGIANFLGAARAINGYGIVAVEIGKRLARLQLLNF